MLRSGTGLEVVRDAGGEYSWGKTAAPAAREATLQAVKVTMIRRCFCALRSHTDTPKELHILEALGRHTGIEPVTTGATIRPTNI
ncbi:hypothetical protein [Aromatoleum bremense]|uniref:Uncharacterized protein n=1 Tax=Aromatoleum bremense TaxID=76115 RepID=A0ABX1NZ49_9RHOO|nr:hypothetical protein [Aromatoleum bremense]NMG17058.1 hypothetical protein [Aromatoleum bremense]